jgi:hypothetical protein
VLARLARSRGAPGGSPSAPPRPRSVEASTTASASGTRSAARQAHARHGLHDLHISSQMPRTSSVNPVHGPARASAARCGHRRTGRHATVSGAGCSRSVHRCRPDGLPRAARRSPPEPANVPSRGVASRSCQRSVTSIVRVTRDTRVRDRQAPLLPA